MSNILRFLSNLSDEARAAEVARNLARTAVSDAIHFGRSQDVIDDLARKAAELDGTPQVQIEVPRAPQDPVSMEYAAVGGPRKWAEERVLKAAGEQALADADGPSSEALDAIRSNALMRSRIDRLSPEQRAQSVAALAFQADDDARVARMAQAAAAERRKAQMKAVADAVAPFALPAAAIAPPAIGVGLAVPGALAGVGGQSESLARQDRRRISAKHAAQMLDEMAAGIDMGAVHAEQAVADLTDMRGVTAPEPEIFGADDQIAFDKEDPAAAISRILEQRYSRR
jgi:hypothetical protein